MPIGSLSRAGLWLTNVRPDAASHWPARSESDQKANYVKFQVLALQDPPGVIPYVINHVNAYRKNVKGFQSSPMMWLDLRQVTIQ